MLAGGAYGNEARIISENGKMIAKISGMRREVLTCDWSYSDERFLVGGGDGYVRVYDITLPEIEPEDGYHY